MVFIIFQIKHVWWHLISHILLISLNEKMKWLNLFVLKMIKFDWFCIKYYIKVTLYMRAHNHTIIIMHGTFPIWRTLHINQHKKCTARLNFSMWCMWYVIHVPFEMASSWPSYDIYPSLPLSCLHVNHPKNITNIYSTVIRSLNYFVYSSNLLFFKLKSLLMMVL